MATAEYCRQQLNITSLYLASPRHLTPCFRNYISWRWRRRWSVFLAGTLVRSSLWNATRLELVLHRSELTRTLSSLSSSSLSLSSSCLVLHYITSLKSLDLLHPRLNPSREAERSCIRQANSFTLDSIRFVMAQKSLGLTSHQVQSMRAPGVCCLANVVREDRRRDERKTFLSLFPFSF